jgi:hypothetical protein
MRLQDSLTNLADQFEPATERLYEQAMRTSKRRRDRRAVAAATAVALLASLGTALVLRPDLYRPPAAGAGVTASPLPPGTSGQLVPPGALDLANQTIDLPPMTTSPLLPPCSGRTTFGNYAGVVPGRSTLTAPLGTEDPSIARIGQEWVGDVNQDGQADTLALVTCEQSGLTNWQVIAVSNTHPSGSTATVNVIGQVLAMAPRPAPEAFFDLHVAANGDIVAEVGDYVTKLDPTNPASRAASAALSTHQERTYRWNGQAFTQVAGPTAFPANPNFNRIRLVKAELSYGPVRDGQRTGTLTLSVRNDGPAGAQDVTAYGAYNLFNRLPDLPGPSVCLEDGRVDPDPVRFECRWGRVAAGATVTDSQTFTVPASIAIARLDDQQSFVTIGAHDDQGYGCDVDPQDDAANPNHLPLGADLKVTVSP